MKIGVIGAMQMEVDTLKESMENIQTEVYSGVTYVSGTIAGKEVVAAVCGIGKVFAGGKNDLRCSLRWCKFCIVL